MLEWRSRCRRMCTCSSGTEAAACKKLQQDFYTFRQIVFFQMLLFHFKKKRQKSGLRLANIWPVARYVCIGERFCRLFISPLKVFFTAVRRKWPQPWLNLGRRRETSDPYQSGFAAQRWDKDQLTWAAAAAALWVTRSSSSCRDSGHDSSAGTIFCVFGPADDNTEMGGQVQHVLRSIRIYPCLRRWSEYSASVGQLEKFIFALLNVRPPERRE